MTRISFPFSRTLEFWFSVLWALIISIGVWAAAFFLPSSFFLRLWREGKSEILGIAFIPWERSLSRDMDRFSRNRLIWHHNVSFMRLLSVNKILREFVYLAAMWWAAKESLEDFSTDLKISCSNALRKKSDHGQRHYVVRWDHAKQIAKIVFFP